MPSKPSMLSMLSMLTLLFLLFLNPLHSQPAFPPNYPVFDSSVVARIDIAINPDTLEWIYENVESNDEFHADFIFRNGTINDTLDDIGFRLGGNTSRYSFKKSFNISFNTFVTGREFYELENLNLNGEHNDPSVIRSRLCWEMLRSFNIPAPRSAHCQVYINGNYYGLYIMVEHINEEFTQSRFGNKNGNLYKCLWPADLAYLGPDQELYKEMSGDRRFYDLKTNTAADDYSDLVHFIDILNNTPLESLACQLDEVFNIQDYLKIIAVDIITGNWDGYIYNKNNFYLYRNTATGKFEYLPYDLDNTLGIDWLDRDWGTRDIYDWEQHGTEVRPLYARLLEVPELRDQYSYYMDQLIGMLSDEDSLFAHIDAVRTMIAPSVINDPYYPLDYGYTYQDFLNSYNQALGGHVDYGLKPYIQTRISSASDQLELNNINPVIKYIKSDVGVPGEEYWVRAYIEDEDPAPTVWLNYRINNGITQFGTMYDDGTHHDKEPGDKYYGCELSPLQINITLTWQVYAKDLNDNSSLYPCEPFEISIFPSSDPRLFINEIMASNNLTIADEYGEFEDWIEIYNGDDIPVYLGDKYISDKLSDPNKFKLPDILLPAGQFLLLWADDQDQQGYTHLNFKLDAGGEEIGLFDSPQTGYFMLDSVSYGAQTTDISFGRASDGNEQWIPWAEPTPGTSNTAQFIWEKDKEDDWVIYPNPIAPHPASSASWRRGVASLHSQPPFSGKIINLRGEILWQGSDASVIPLNDLPAGLYLLISNSGKTRKLLVL